MAIRRRTHHCLTPEILLRAYSIGIFPMASRRSDPDVHWVAPTMRGILPLTEFRVPRKLRRTVRSNTFDVRCDTAFPQVIEACAAPREGHPESWINAEISRAFFELYRLGHAHSIETWQDGQLVGGLYGLAMGGAFFGESMFSRATDASKVALVHLVARLLLGRFVLLDVQFVTDHLRQFGAIEIPAAEYNRRLDEALQVAASFYRAPPPEVFDPALGALFTQSSTLRS